MRRSSTRSLHDMPGPDPTHASDGAATLPIDAPAIPPHAEPDRPDRLQPRIRRSYEREYDVLDGYTHERTIIRP